MGPLELQMRVELAESHPRLRFTSREAAALLGKSQSRVSQIARGYKIDRPIGRVDSLATGRCATFSRIEMFQLAAYFDKTARK